MESMTGFGRGSAESLGREATIELKSVNHRYLDISVRAPRSLSNIEDIIRKRISSWFSRGKIEVAVTYSNLREDRSDIQVDLQLAKSYTDALKEIAKHTGLKNKYTITDIASFPQVITLREKEEDEDAVFAVISEALDKACAMLKDMRTNEGERLKTDLKHKIECLEGYIAEIEEKAPLVDKYQTEKLLDKMKEFIQGDEVIRQRVLAEAALIAEKHAIDEEIVRLKSHIRQFLMEIDGQEETGRKLDFIVQEMNREVNTIGSKANNAEIAALVIQCKSELEKIREQVQNIQ